MAKDFKTPTFTDRKKRYDGVIQQIQRLVEGEPNLIANLANISAALKYGMDFFWVGFYIVEGDELVLGPFQGTVACTRIPKGKGVCGKAWEQKKPIIVEDVNKFPGHIACSEDSKSEIVLPVFHKNEVALIMDIDSDRPGDFGLSDQSNLNKLVSIIRTLLDKKV